MADDHGSPCFEHCVFTIIPSKDLPPSRIAELQQTIEDHAGQVQKVGSNGIRQINNLSHIISTTSDFREYSTARELMVAVVTPSWITASLLKNKQAPIRPFTPDPMLFFSQVNITCADIPTGDKDAIIGAVLAMGGVESSSLTKTTTHVCALTMDHPKCQQVKEKNLKCKIVLPHWFDDCLKLGKRIDEGPYELPDPEIFRLNPEDSVPIPAIAHIQGATSPHPESFPIPTDSPTTRHLDVFKDRTVMISDDLAMASRLRKIIEDLIKEGGGQITNSVHGADIYVCHWRSGRDYVFASRAGIDVGNLSWLYHLITHNEWTSPLRRLLHYPLPESGIPGFKNYRITLSNYGGEARVYLENLVVAAGGEFTKSMKQDNTHLITARQSSEKCAAAMEWNIEMVNHLWLEETYAKCQVQKLTDPRYTHFPPRTNLGEIIGQTQLDPALIQSLYFPKDPTPSPNDPKPLRRPVMSEKDRNASNSRKSGEITDGQGDADMKDSVEDLAVRPKSAIRPRLSSKAATAGQISTPIANRRVTSGKENGTPSSTGSRSAKDKALSNLQHLAPDIALYEKERKRKGHVWGGERAANKMEKEKSLARSSSPDDNDNEDDYSDQEGPTPKRTKTGAGLPPVEIRLLVTGYKGWLGNIVKEDTEKKKLRKLGILVVQDPTNCTHLAAPRMVRTQKFLCALATGPIIVSSEFIDVCIRDGELPDAKDYLLHDQDSEKKFKLKLQDAISRAKENNRGLLRGIPIYCTAEIPNGPETYRAIVQSNGGIFNIYRARGGSTIKPTNPEDDDGPPEPVYLLTGTRPEERKLWDKFSEMAKAGNMIPRVVLHEWLLDVSMSQQLKWSEKYLARTE